MLRSLLVLSVLVPGLVAAVASSYWALMMYLWYALFRPQDWLWIDINSLRLSLVIGVVMMVRSLTSGVFPNVTNPLTLGMALLVVSSIVTNTTAVRPDIGWIWIDYLFRLALSSLMVAAIATDGKRLYGILTVICASMGFHAAKAGLAFILTAGRARFDQGLSGAFVDNNGYALGTVMIMPLLLVSAQNVDLVYQGKLHKWIRRGLYAATTLCAFTVIGTYSRGGFLALSAGVFVYIMLQKRRFTALAGCVAALAIVLAVVPIPERYYERLSTIKSYDSNKGEDVEGARESAQSRPHFWRVGLLMVAAHPLGVGLKQYEAAYDLFDFSFGRYGHHRAVHNSHVQVLAELGYFGLAVWIVLWVYAYFACMRIRWRSRAVHLSPQHQRLFYTMANGLLTSMTGFIVGGSFLSLAYNDLTWLTFGMVAGLDRLSARLSEAPADAPVIAVAVAAAPARVLEPVAAAALVPAAARALDVDVPVAFRAVASYGAGDAGGRR